MSVQADRPMRRLFRLIEEMRDELENRWGWQGEVAKQLGIDASYVSRIVNQQRSSVGLQAIANAIIGMKIRAEYFFGDPEPRSYQHYVGNRYAAFDEFCRGDHGRTLSPKERATLSSIDFQGDEPTALSYQALLLGLRGAMPARVSEIATFNKAVDDQMKARPKKAAPRGDHKSGQ